MTTISTVVGNAKTDHPPPPHRRNRRQHPCIGGGGGGAAAATRSIGAGQGQGWTVLLFARLISINKSSQFNDEVSDIISANIM